MGRRIDFEDEALVLRYGGLDGLLTMVGEVRVPYDEITSVSVGPADPPRALAFKIGLSTPPFGTTQRGRFREHGEWSVDEPEGFAARLHERMPPRG